MSETLDSRVAIITGASAGIGEATARELARKGMDVVLAARRRDRLESIAEDIRDTSGVDALAVPTDIRDEDDVAALVETTVKSLDGLDVLVNNAGLERGDDIAAMTTREYRTMIETNVDGVFFATRAALPHLRESEGHLVFVGSFVSRYPGGYNPVYAATKWWVRGFALSVKASAGPDGVAVSLVNPSEVRTEFGAAEGESFAERFEKGTVLEPEEVAEAIAFAATRRSAVGELDLYRRDKLEMF